MRRNSSPTINLQMYRHFAVLTVAITALMAFFANGENDKAAAAAAADIGARSAKPVAERPKPAPVAEADEDRGSWGSDGNDGFGEPMMRSGGLGAWMAGPSASLSAQRATTGGSPLANGDGDATESAPAAEPSAAQIAAAAAASRLRSGAPGND